MTTGANNGYDLKTLLFEQRSKITEMDESVDRIAVATETLPAILEAIRMEISYLRGDLLNAATTKDRGVLWLTAALCGFMGILLAIQLLKVGNLDFALTRDGVTIEQARR